MAKIKLNDLFQEMSGSIGDLTPLPVWAVGGLLGPLLLRASPCVDEDRAFQEIALPFPS